MLSRGRHGLSQNPREITTSLTSYFPPTGRSPLPRVQISRTTTFIANGKFRRVALQFPDPLLREAPEVLWTLQARLRKLAAGAAPPAEKHDDVGGWEVPAAEAAAREPPLIFVTGDTSYGSCCVDEVSAQHLKADAIVHYGRKYDFFLIILNSKRPRCASKPCDLRRFEGTFLQPFVKVSQPALPSILNISRSGQRRSFYFVVPLSSCLVLPLGARPLRMVSSQ